MKVELKKKLAIVLPCFNEQATILEIIERVKDLPIDKSLMVIDNCSTDGTRELLRSVCVKSFELESELDRLPLELRLDGQELLRGDGFTVLLQPRNLHKGSSVKLGIALANSEYVICQDADLEYDPSDILRLLDHAERTGSVAVFGSRTGSLSLIQLDAFQMGRVALTKCFQVLYASKIADVATCYKLVKTDILQDLEMRASGFDLDFEIPARLRRLNHDIEDVPIGYNPRDGAAGKKIRWRDGFSALWTLLQIRFSSAPHVRSDRNPMD